MATLHMDNCDKARRNAGADVQAGPVDIVVQRRETAIKRFRFDEAWPPFGLGAEIHAPSWTAMRHNELLSLCGARYVREVTQPNRTLSRPCSLRRRLPYIGSSTDL
jgi:hypothetical protein